MWYSAENEAQPCRWARIYRVIDGVSWIIRIERNPDMTDYKFDGKELHNRSGNTIGVLDGKYIRDGHGNKVGEIDGIGFRDSHESKIADFDGRDIRDSSSTKIATLADVKSSIDGIGDASLVAMWLFFVM